MNLSSRSVRPARHPRVLLTGMENWKEAACAQEGVLAAVKPASTFVQVAGFIHPEWLVEIDVDAVVAVNLSKEQISTEEGA